MKIIALPFLNIALAITCDFVLKPEISNEILLGSATFSKNLIETWPGSTAFSKIPDATLWDSTKFSSITKDEVGYNVCSSSLAKKAIDGVYFTPLIKLEVADGVPVVRVRLRCGRLFHYSQDNYVIHSASNEFVDRALTIEGGDTIVVMLDADCRDQEKKSRNGFVNEAADGKWERKIALDEWPTIMTSHEENIFATWTVKLDAQHNNMFLTPRPSLFKRNHQQYPIIKVEDSFPPIMRLQRTYLVKEQEKVFEENVYFATRQDASFVSLNLSGDLVRIITNNLSGNPGRKLVDLYLSRDFIGMINQNLSKKSKCKSEILKISFNEPKFLSVSQINNELYRSNAPV